MDPILCESGNPTLQSPLNIAAKDKFILVLNLPYALRRENVTDPTVDIEPLQIKVHGSVVPNVSVPANEVRYAGQSYNVSSHSRMNYSPLNVNFIIDNQFKNYWIIWKWLSLLNTYNESLYGGGGDKVPPSRRNNAAELGNLIEYQSNFSMLALDEYNTPIAEFVYYNAFPISLGSINYSYRDSENIECSAEFQFSQLELKINFKKANERSIIF
jgi:hypothetical protein